MNAKIRRVFFEVWIFSFFSWFGIFYTLETGDLASKETGSKHFK